MTQARSAISASLVFGEASASRFIPTEKGTPTWSSYSRRVRRRRRGARSRSRTCEGSPGITPLGEGSAGRRGAVEERHGSFAWLYQDGAPATPLVSGRIKEVLSVPSPHVSVGVSRPPGWTKTPESVYGLNRNECTKTLGIRRTRLVRMRDTPPRPSRDPSRAINRRAPHASALGRPPSPPGGHASATSKVVFRLADQRP